MRLPSSRVRTAAKYLFSTPTRWLRVVRGLTEAGSPVKPHRDQGASVPYLGLDAKRPAALDGSNRLAHHERSIGEIEPYALFPIRIELGRPVGGFTNPRVEGGTSGDEVERTGRGIPSRVRFHVLSSLVPVFEELPGQESRALAAEGDLRVLGHEF